MRIDPYFNTKLCVNRLYEVYKKHGSIIIACDFDETIFPFHSPDDKFHGVIEVLQQCSELDWDIVIFTSGLNERHDFMRQYCNESGINIRGININTRPEINFGRDGAKIYYNILLDDKAGLGQSTQILKEVVERVFQEKLIQNQN